MRNCPMPKATFIELGISPVSWWYLMSLVVDQAQVVQKLDSAIHRINLYPVDNAICFPNTYQVDSDLSRG